MSFRSWASVITVVFLAAILFFARNEIAQAWQLLSRVNLYVLSLVVVAQVVVYFIAGEMMFTYLRDKKAIKDIGVLQQARMALEMNFVNHALPSAGVSGISYMTWRLKKYGISGGRATLAQFVRFIASFAAFTTLLIIALVAITIDGNINRWVILFSSLIVFLMIAATVAGIALFGSPSRSRRFSNWLVRLVNKSARLIRIPAKKFTLSVDPLLEFFDEMHDDYLQLKKEKKLLLKPYLWGLLFMAGEVLIFMITFWALGEFINPAPVLIAFGLAMIAGFIVVTPGGAGAFEAIMVSFLAIAGVGGGVAIAGILLTRVIQLLGTIILGYFFYQHSLIKYGKPKLTR